MADGNELLVRLFSNSNYVKVSVILISEYEYELKEQTAVVYFCGISAVNLRYSNGVGPDDLVQPAQLYQ